MKKNLFMCLILISGLWSNEINAQSSSGSPSYVPGNYLGWSTAGGPLPFKINSNQYMSLTTGGLLGIGTTFTPTYKLDVDNGDINLNTSTKAFRIGGNVILWHNNHPEDIFVGVDAGNGTMTGHSNTLAGNVAGNSITSGTDNVAVGDSAGSGITTGYDNTYVGYTAGKNNAGGWSNTGVGYQSLKNTTAYGGCAFGYNTATLNTLGCSLCAMGENALYANLIGNNNNAFGYNALNNNKSLSNNVAIGANALATQNYNGVTDGSLSSYNVAVGGNALAFNNPTSSTTGIKNSALGVMNFSCSSSSSSKNGCSRISCFILV